MRIGYLITAIVVGLLLILALQYRDVWLSGWGPFRTEPPEIAPELTLREALPPVVPQLVAAEPVEAVAAPIEIPALSESDAYMRDLLSGFAAPAPWLTQSELARRLSVILTSAAGGVLPRGQLDFLLPEAGFPVQAVGDDGKAFILDPAGYARFAPVVDALLSVDPDTMAEIFLAAEPLLDSAVVELGERQGVRALLNQALNQVLTTPVLTQPVVLKKPEALYEFADPALEELSDLQKQLLRMGPGALERLQIFANQVVAVLSGASVPSVAEPQANQETPEEEQIESLGDEQ